MGQNLKINAFRKMFLHPPLMCGELTRKKSLPIKFKASNPLFFTKFLRVNDKSNLVNSKFYWLSKYLSFFLKNVTNLPINWQFLNLQLVSHKDNLITLWNNTYSRYFLKIFFCSGWFYFYIILQLYFFKNIDTLCSFIVKIIQKQPLKYHKHLFQRINILFSEYLRILHKTKKLRGYRIYFKGKLGRKGSVKKSTLYFKDGRVSYTNKSLRYNYKYFLIPTETGVVGCYISIFY